MKTTTRLLVPLLFFVVALTWFTLASADSPTDQPDPDAARRAAFRERQLADFAAGAAEAEHPHLSAAVACEGGSAGIYPCDGIDLLSFTPLSTFSATAGNDIWGWTDPVTGKEYALMGVNNGTVFVDITNPEIPVYLGKLPTHTFSSSWRDVKVYQDHAFVVSEASGHGMQVFDLTRLRSVTIFPTTFSADAHYGSFGSAHNIVINDESGYAYAVGGNCSGGLHMIDISTPTSPTFAGCFSSDGYTHDAQCVTYSGPDIDYTGREICFNANEDTVTIVDVTDKSAPAQIARVGYPGAEYTHQVWLMEDQATLLVDDELDEISNGHNTRTYIWDTTDLDLPQLLAFEDGATGAIDHNLYVNGLFAFQSNYRAGLRIVDLHQAASGKLTEAAYFDIYPASNSASFNGNWSNYPYFASGSVIVSGIEQGLFVVRPTVAPLGDVSCDLNSDVVDALFVLQYDVGLRDATSACPLATDQMYEPACDVSGDGACGVVDALFMLQCDVGLTNPYCP